MIKINEGPTDRVIRIFVGIVALGLTIFVLSGVAQVIALIVALAALVTGITGFCGLYTLLGINTCSMKK